MDVPHNGAKLIEEVIHGSDVTFRGAIILARWGWLDAKDLQASQTRSAGKGYMYQRMDGVKKGVHTILGKVNKRYLEIKKRIRTLALRDLRA
jgi:hypothetical protein